MPVLRRRWTLTLSAVTVLVVATAIACGGKGDVILATTTSTQDSGLLDVLVPIFEKRTGYNVKVIAVGSGQALAMGRRGDADAILAHAPQSEEELVAQGQVINRRLVMHNDFLIMGPAADPAGITRLASATDALKQLAASGSLFISRGDDSGTHQLELRLWQEAGLRPQGQPWYQESGQGMGATLTIADQKAAYTISDRATYLALRQVTGLAILVEGDPILLNIYHVMQVNPEVHPRVNAEGARAFIEFMVSPDVQRAVGEFGLDKYGQALFFPDAGRDERELTGGR